MQTTNKFIVPKRNFKSSVSYCDPVILSRSELHKTFSGYIYEGDYVPVYSMNHTMSGITDRILQDHRFDVHCERNLTNTLNKNKENISSLKESRNE